MRFWVIWGLAHNKQHLFLSLVELHVAKWPPECQKTHITWPCQMIFVVLFWSSKRRMSSRPYFHTRRFWGRNGGPTFRHTWLLWIKNYYSCGPFVPILLPLPHVASFARTWENVAPMWNKCDASANVRLEFGVLMILRFQLSHRHVIIISNDSSDCVDVCFCNDRSGSPTMWF